MGTIDNAVIKTGMKMLSVEQRSAKVEKMLMDAMEIVNTDPDINVSRIQREDAYGEERSVLLRISEFPGGGFLFKLKNERIERVYDSETPTFIIIMTEDVLIRLALGQYDYRDIVWNSEAWIDGEDIARDYLVFRDFFTRFGDICRRLVAF